MSEYAYEVDVDVRLRDVDFMGHVNNAIYATYLEQAREAYFVDVIGKSLVETDTVLASLEIEYERPIEAGQAVTVAIGVPEVGTSSLVLAYEIRADGDEAASALTTQVLVDPDTGKPRPIPDEWRERIDAAGIDDWSDR
ncbi:acyl-CoA thioesterase [Natrialbaceae archaeon GCM10025810]|uniref:acyl-CoA thioesterase n=1 Tax=Halovalidus salilacus TaxID=3075124 RepID=UPI00361B1E7F